MWLIIFYKQILDIEDLDDIIEEIVKDEDFVSSEIECEAYDNIDEMKNATRIW